MTVQSTTRAAHPITGLIVSCQTRGPSPLAGPAFMSAMATAAMTAGASGIRANGAADIAAIRVVVDLPIIGIDKAARLHHPRPCVNRSSRRRRRNRRGTRRDTQAKAWRRHAGPTRRARSRP